MSDFSIISLDRNSRFSLAIVKNRAEQNHLNAELGHLDNEKKTALRMLQNDKICFKLKYAKSGVLKDKSQIFDETLSKYYIPSDFGKHEEIIGLSTTKNSGIDFEQIHNMLFTHNEVDKEKIMCLHLISAHRTESLSPPKKKAALLCKIHCPLERLLERSKRKHIHLEQKMTSMLPIYTIEAESDRSNDPINDGRLANRLLLNEKIREIVNTVLNALRKSNPQKNQEIFEMANNVGELKKLFTKRKILDFLEELMMSPLINNSYSFILTAPFRVRPVQLELRTISGSVEQLVRQIRQNVLQLPPRPKLHEEVEGRIAAQGDEGSKRVVRHQKKLLKMQRRSGEDEEEEVPKPKKFSKISSRYRRRSSGSESGNILDRPYIQPVKFNEQVTAIMEDIEKRHEENTRENDESNVNIKKEDETNKTDETVSRNTKTSGNYEHLRIHLKQTTCPACMEKYKIPLPPPKTPRVKPSSVLPTVPGENPFLKTNSRLRLSMLIDREMFKMQSYERRFSSEVTARKHSLRRREMESCSTEQLNLSPLELAKIEQEIREKEIQKKLEKFLNQ